MHWRKKRRNKFGINSKMMVKHATFGVKLNVLTVERHVCDVLRGNVGSVVPQKYF